MIGQIKGKFAVVYNRTRLTKNYEPIEFLGGDLIRKL